MLYPLLKTLQSSKLVTVCVQALIALELRLKAHIMLHPGTVLGKHLSDMMN